jgi:hypothetical protein
MDRERLILATEDPLDIYAQHITWTKQILTRIGLAKDG